MTDRLVASGRASPDLQRLLDPAAALELFREAGLRIDGVERTYVRLKPDDAAIVAFRFRPAAGDGTRDDVHGYVRTSADVRPAILADKWTRLRPQSTALGEGVRVLPGGRSVLFLFPNDAGLRGLRFVADLQTLKRTLNPLPRVSERGFRIRGRKSTLAVIRYKPEQRFIARLGLAMKNDASQAKETLRAVMRFFRDRRGNAIADAAARLRSRGVRVPEPFGAVAGGRIQVEEEVEGDALLPRILEGNAPIEEIAASLAAFHRVRPPDVPPTPPSPSVLLGALGDSYTTIASSPPGVLRLLEEVLRALERALPGRHQAFIHRDFHVHQVLLARHGPVIVDLERAGAGDPFEDVGNFVAHLVQLGLDAPASRRRMEDLEERFLEGYRLADPGGAGGRSPSDLEFFVGRALVQLAFLPYRRGERDWDEHARSLLEETRRRLEKGREPAATSGPGFFTTETATGETGAIWDVFHPRIGGPWPGFLMRPGRSERIFGSYDPAADRFSSLAPTEDPALRHGRHWFEAGEIVSCRTGHRATVRVQAGARTVFVKVLPPSKATKLARRHRAAVALRLPDPAGPIFAPLLEDRSDEGILVLGALGGASLHDSLKSNGGSAPLEGVARALARFHAARVDADALPPAPHPPDLGALAGLAARHGGMRAVDYLAAAALLPGPPLERGLAPVHGDLHDRNVLLDGERVALLDLDLFHVGNPAEDVGNLGAHLILRALQRGDPPERGREAAQRLFEDWRLAGGGAGDAELEAVMARTLFRLACLYTFRRRWRRLVPFLLDQVRA